MVLAPEAALADGAAVQAGNASAKVGETVEIPVTLAGNLGIARAMFDIIYDENLLALKSIEKGAVFSGGAFSSATEQKKVQWYDLAAEATADGVMFTLFVFHAFHALAE